MHPADLKTFQRIRKELRAMDELRPLSCPDIGDNCWLKGKGKMNEASPSTIAVDPKLPAGFYETRNEDRPRSHQKWWYRPYIETYTWERMSQGAPGPANATAEERALWSAKWRLQWFQSWPSGTRYDVRCLDGGAWDRPTCWGVFGTLDEAIACAESRSS